MDLFYVFLCWGDLFVHCVDYLCIIHILISRKHKFGCITVLGIVVHIFKHICIYSHSQLLTGLVKS